MMNGNNNNRPNGRISSFGNSSGGNLPNTGGRSNVHLGHVQQQGQQTFAYRGGFGNAWNQYTAAGGGGGAPCDNSLWTYGVSPRGYSQGYGMPQSESHMFETLEGAPPEDEILEQYYGGKSQDDSRYYVGQSEDIWPQGSGQDGFDSSMGRVHQGSSVYRQGFGRPPGNTGMLGGKVRCMVRPGMKRAMIGPSGRLFGTGMENVRYPGAMGNPAEILEEAELHAMPGSRAPFDVVARQKELKLEQELKVRESQLIATNALIEHQTKLIAKASILAKVPGIEENMSGYSRMPPYYYGKPLSPVSRPVKRPPTAFGIRDFNPKRRYTDRESSYGGNKHADNFQDGNRSQGSAKEVKPVTNMKQQLNNNKEDEEKQDTPNVTNSHTRRSPGPGTVASNGTPVDEKVATSSNGERIESPKLVDDKYSLTYCYACNEEYRTYENLQRHEGTKNHEKYLFELKDSRDQTKIQWFARIRRLGHLREKEINSKRPGLSFCETCDQHYGGSNEDHLLTPNHKLRDRHSSKGCQWCKINSFPNYLEVYKHRENMKHIQLIKMFGILKSQENDQPTENISDPSDIPDFEEGNPVGLAFVSRCYGFFCKLCKKFYQSEVAVKADHCASEYHYKKWKQHHLNNLKADLKKNTEQSARSHSVSSGKSEKPCAIKMIDTHVTDDEQTTKELTNGTGEEFCSQLEGTNDVFKSENITNGLNDDKMAQEDDDKTKKAGGNVSEDEGDDLKEDTKSKAYGMVEDEVEVKIEAESPEIPIIAQNENEELAEDGKEKQCENEFVQNNEKEFLEGDVEQVETVSILAWRDSSKRKKGRGRGLGKGRFIRGSR